MINSLLFTWLLKGGQDVFSTTVGAGLSATAASTYFTGLATQVAAATTSYDAYVTARDNATANGGREEVTARNTAKANLVALLRPLISNINAMADGDEAALISSGFPMRKTTRTPLGPRPTPTAPKVKPGPTSGSMKASTNAIYGVSNYTARVALASAPTVYVQTVVQSSSRFLFEGLTPGELYNVDISATGAAGTTDCRDAGCSRTM